MFRPKISWCFSELNVRTTIQCSNLFTYYTVFALNLIIISCLHYHNNIFATLMNSSCFWVHRIRYFSFCFRKQFIEFQCFLWFFQIFVPNKLLILKKQAQFVLKILSAFMKIKTRRVFEMYWRYKTCCFVVFRRQTSLPQLYFETPKQKMSLVLILALEF